MIILLYFKLSQPTNFNPGENMRLSLSLLFATVFLPIVAYSAEPEKVQLVVQGLMQRGEVLPPEVKTFSVTDGGTSVNVTTTLRGWGYKTTACTRYSLGAGLAYMTVLEGDMGMLMTAVKVPRSNGGVWNIVVTDVGLDGTVDEIRTDPGAPSVSRTEAQDIFNYMVGCFIVGG